MSSQLLKGSLCKKVFWSSKKILSEGGNLLTIPFIKYELKVQFLGEITQGVHCVMI